MQISDKSNEEVMLLYKDTHDIALKQEITLRYVYLLRIIVRQMKNVYVSFTDADDMINEGVLILMDAIDNFDPTKNVKFETYVSFRIRGAIIDIARKQDWVPRSVRKSIRDIDDAIGKLYNELHRYPTDEEIANRLGITVEKYLKLLSDGSLCNILSLNTLLTESLQEPMLKPVGNSKLAPAPELSLQNKELKALLAEAINDLKPNEKTVISLYYIEEISIKEIAYVLELSESRISQIHSKALLKLRHMLSNYVKM